MSLACFDNHILVWGIKEEASPGQEEMIPRAKAFIRHLEQNHTAVLIPAVVVAEFLIRIPQHMHALVLNLFDRSFVIASFDTVAASVFAKLWQAKEQGTIGALLKNGKTRSELQIDRLIVATAISRRADCIYSHDRGVKAFAKGHIDVKEMPFIPTQLETGI